MLAAATKTTAMTTTTTSTSTTLFKNLLSHDSKEWLDEQGCFSLS
jgi:hypothetical protein